MARQNWVIFLGGMCVFLVGVGNYWSATWLSKWAILLGLLTVVLSVWAAKRTSWAHFPLMVYVSLHLVALGLWPGNPYASQFDQITVLAIEKNALYALLQFVGLVLLMCSISRKMSFGITTLLSTIWATGVIGTLLLPGSGPHSPPNNGMWFGNPSMGASLLACLLPFIWSLYHAHARRSWQNAWVFPVTTWIMTLVAVFRTKASVPWGVLGVVTAAILLSRTSKKRAFWCVCGVFFLGFTMIILGQRLLGRDFWDQNGRFEIWQMAWDWFTAHGNLALGMGYSSTETLLPIEQVMTNHYTGAYFLWLHNDWLQLVIEGGYIGTACLLLSVARLLTVSWPRPALFASLMGFVAMGFFNYPLRTPIHCMCLILISGIAEANAIRVRSDRRVPGSIAQPGSRTWSLSRAFRSTH